MKYYPSQLLIVLSLNHSIPPALVIQANQKVSQQEAVERFFTANQLSPDWFSPGTLRINNLSELQKRRDDLKAKIKQKNWEYHRVELITKNRYRIIVDNASPNIIIGIFKFDWMDRIYEIEMEINYRQMRSINFLTQINDEQLLV
jgi:hypothetical protein